MRRWLAVLVLLLAPGLPGCADDVRGADREAAQRERSITSLPDPSARDLPELGEALLIALAQARNHHHKADVYLRDGQLDSAIESVRQILAIPFPEDAAEAEDVMLDARARLAKLESAKGRLDEAMRVVDEGVATATRRSFFLANLYTVKGEVYEAMAHVLDAKDTDAAREQARAARRSAIEAFNHSIAINSELQQALMHEGIR